MNAPHLGTAGVASLLLVLAALPAFAADQIALTATASNAAAGNGATFLVTGVNGSYDRLVGKDVRITLKLTADPGAGDENRRILAADLRLKSDSDAASSVTIPAFDGKAPRDTLELNEQVTLPVTAESNFVRDAISACTYRPAPAENAADQPTAVALQVVFRVVTGTFNFRWTNYDQVGQAEEFKKNPDFYSDRKSFEADATAIVSVLCAPLAPATAATPQTNPGAAPASGPQAESVSEASSGAAAPASKLACEGGIVRHLDSGGGGVGQDLCVCPGNTTRVATGDKSYACQRKFFQR